MCALKAKLSFISCYISCHLAHSTFNPQFSAKGRTERNNGCFNTLAFKRQLACISRHISSMLTQECGWDMQSTRTGGQTALSIPHYNVICLKTRLAFFFSSVTPNKEIEDWKSAIMFSFIRSDMHLDVVYFYFRNLNSHLVSRSTE